METDTLVIGTKCTSNVNLSPSRALIDAQVLRQIRNVCDCWLRRYTRWWSLLFLFGGQVEKLSQESEASGVHQITHIIINWSV